MPAQFSNILFLAVVFAAMYFLLIRPQQQRAKKQAEMISKLEPGTEILTIGGMYGTIVEIGDDRVRLRIADGSEVEFVRRAVSSIVTPTEAEELEALDEAGHEDDASATSEDGDDE